MLFLFLVTKLPCTTTEKVHYILKRVYRCCTAYFYLCFLIFPLYLCDMILRKHSYFRYICILIYSCLMPVLLHSQNVVKQISNADGLSNNSVNCFLEDSEHTLWVGTWDGLNAYNGRSFKTYSYNKNAGSISNNVVWQIIEQNDSVLWVSTDYGVNRWKRSTQQFTPYYLGTQNNPPKQEKSFLLDITSGKYIICYVKEQGLFYFDDRKQDFVPLKNNLPDGIKNFVIDAKDQVFFLTEHGQLLHYQLSVHSSNLELSFKKEIKQPAFISSIYLSQDYLIINDDRTLTVSLDNRILNSIDIPENKTVSQVICHKEYLLISLSKGGCIRYNLKDNTSTELPQLPAKAPIFTIYIGSQNILWVGTDGQGVLEVYEHSSPFHTIKTDYPVRCFCEEDNGNILVGTKGEGILLLDKQKRQVEPYLSTDNGLISNSVYTIRKNMSGDIFIGTEGTGINYIPLNSSQVKKLNIPAEYPTFKAVYSILFTHNDSLLWLGTSGYGLIKLSLQREGKSYKVTEMKQYKSPGPSSPSNNIIYSVIAGYNENELWLGTRGGGINKFDITSECFQQIHEIDSTLSLTNNDILYLTKGDSASIWVGTSYGLNRLFPADIPPSIMEYTDHNGLPNNTIHGILKDENGNIWASTNQGISFINLSSGKITNYSSRNGLQNDEFSDGAIFKDKAGWLYFGGVSGLNYFDENKIHLRDHIATLSLNSLKINNTSQNIYERILNHTLRLAYDEPYLTLGFTTHDFINNENCEFSYRIIDFADEWIYNENNPNIVITKLPPGKYKLEVKCTNGDRVWSNQIYSLHLDVAYPWWLSTTAFIIYFILIAIAIYITQSVIKNRIRLNRQILLEHIEKQNQQRIHESKLNFFTNVAHEFFTPLTLIYGPAQHLLEKADLDSYTKRYIYIIKNNADRMQKLINELMEFRKAESGHTAIYAEKVDIHLLVDYVSDNYTEIAEENKIDFSFKSKEVSSFTTDRNSLEKIIFNLLSNAFKYTPSGGYLNAEIRQNATTGTLHFRIRNSGKGLTEKQTSEIFSRFKIFESSKLKHAGSTGVGLNLTKSLTELLGGEITIESTLGEYVEFNVSLPPMYVNSEKESQATEEETEVSEMLFIPKQKEITILIVEDEKNIRELLKDILLPYYQVREAGNGEEALKEVEQKQPDIIISDVLMPKLDGITLTDILKSNERTMHIPVIHISAKNSIEDQINAYNHGTDLYIPKPFHPRHVLSAVENMINKYSLMKEYFKSGRSSLIVRDGITMHKEDELLLNKIIKFIEDNIDDESMNPDSLADFIGVSKAGLYRKLKELTEKTPSEFVRTIRLEYAAGLLKTTKLTVTEIMYKSGFSNKSYFYREFTKLYNTSPKEYRSERTEKKDIK